MGFKGKDLLYKCKEGGNLEGNEIRTFITLTVAFVAVFTAFNALQNMHSSLHDENSLGLVCLSCIYGTGILSSVLSPTLIGFFGAKMVLVLSFAAHCLYIVSNFYPSFATMVPAAVVLGTFYGPAMTSQALYISACSFSFSKSSKASPYAILSRFNMFFFAVFATTQIVGNLVTSVVIRKGLSNTTDEIDVFTFCGRDDCPDNENSTQIEDPEDWVIDITLLFFLACAGFGLVVVVFLLNSLPKSDWVQEVTVKTTVSSFFKVFISTNMLLLAPFIVFTAMGHGLLVGAFTKSYIACPLGIHMVGFVMAVYGASTPVFVVLFTQIARVTGRFILILLALAIHMGILLLLFDWTPTPDGEWLIFVVPIIWGLADSILQAQGNALIALLFSSRKEPAFAVYTMWRNVGYTVTFLNVAHICVSTKLVVAMVCCGVGALLYIAVEMRHKYKEKKSIKDSSTNDPESSEDTGDGHVTMRRQISHQSSILSDEDRQSFNVLELDDVIKEAQNGWSREGGSLMLEVKKVMSKEHLLESKATTWVRTRAALTDATNSTAHDGTPTIKRSVSDGHLAAPYRLGHTEPKPKSAKKRGIYDRSMSVDMGDGVDNPLSIYQGNTEDLNTMNHYSNGRRKSWFKSDQSSLAISSIPEENNGDPNYSLSIDGFSGSQESVDSESVGAPNHGYNNARRQSEGHIYSRRQSLDYRNSGKRKSVDYRNSRSMSGIDEIPAVGDGNFTFVVQTPYIDRTTSHDTSDSEDNDVEDVNKDIEIEFVSTEINIENFKTKKKKKHKSLVIFKPKNKPKYTKSKSMSRKSEAEPDGLFRLATTKYTLNRRMSKTESVKSSFGSQKSVNTSGDIASDGQDEYDSDGFVNDDEMDKKDETENGLFYDIASYSAKKKRSLVPKMESEDVDNIF